MSYFPQENSAAARLGQDKPAVIRLLADRFTALNPPQPFAWRTFDEGGIQADTKGCYHFDFDRRYPEAPMGARAVALGEIYCPQAKNSGFTLRAACPAEVWLNGRQAFAAAAQNGEPEAFRVELNEGWNRVAILAEKCERGFSCGLQNAMPQWEPCCYVTPFASCGGEAGFLWALLPEGEQPTPAALWGTEELLPWQPRRETAPLQEAGIFAGWAAFELAEERCVQWHAPASVSLLVDGGPAAAPLGAGRHELTMRGPLEGLRQVHADGVTLRPPVPVQGRCTPYLVLGPLTDVPPVPLGRVYAGSQVWRPALAGMALRPYVESSLFARWTYPLGVTLYGMLKAGERLPAPDMTAYVQAHVAQVAAIQEYAELDKARYGFPGVNQQICWLDALDDCGSFGALLLRCDPRGENPDIRRLADKIAHYMMREQPCTPAGAFCRRDDTIWADDMYMSVPFLCRYAAMTGDGAPLDFAARQMLHYRELLFLPQKRVMAHMRCLTYSENNGIPWSRGNGWVIFSLSELLMALPEGHPHRAALLAFFRELTEGYLALQAPSGLWHQILDDPQSYLESSATAMMICAFARGSRFGWYDGDAAQRAMTAARRAWQGLTELAIDREGNLYGVCRGSGFSYSRAYYRALSWNFNDTHGIGIVMLAGVELLDN